jgi:O-methyltransferase
MFKAAKKGFRRILGIGGYDLVKLERQRERVEPPVQYPPDFDAQTKCLVEFVKPYTMTSPERIFALRQAVQYITRYNIPGHIVECGVWKGGSMMAVAKTLIELEDTRRNLILFDTFEGMSAPTEKDRQYSGEMASDILQASSKDDVFWCRSPLEAVQQFIFSTGYPKERISFVKGKVEDTLPTHAPDRIAILRLDTDWFESTLHELIHLYPRLMSGGVLIIDDYGHWQGAREAVDRYVSEKNLRLLLNRIDYAGRICVKP